MDNNSISNSHSQQHSSSWVNSIENTSLNGVVVGGGNPSSVSSSTTTTTKPMGKNRQKKESHNTVEQRRRNHINSQIQSLDRLLRPEPITHENSPRASQSAVLTRAIDYIREQELIMKMQHVWDSMIPVIIPLIDYTRDLEQRLSSVGVNYPKRSEELLTQMRRLVYILNTPYRAADAVGNNNNNGQQNHSDHCVSMTFHLPVEEQSDDPSLLYHHHPLHLQDIKDVADFESDCNSTEEL